MTSLCFASPINEKYSNKAFPYHGLSFKDRPVEEFNNTTIRGTCFYQEWVEGDMSIEKDIFPEGMTGVVFEYCNLVNIIVPPGNTISKGCQTERLKVQNDWEDWIMEKKDGKWEAKEPKDKEARVEANLNIDPKNIPKVKWSKNERKVFEDIRNSVDISPIQ